MSAWKWIDRRVLLLLQEESLAEQGGASGLRDEGLLDSALARPLNVSLYEQPDAARLAPAYGLGLAKNHAFVDANKRVAFLAVGFFLAIIGYRLRAKQSDATLVML
ncbi:type II toxin-antitoxin system death-on-curing family toxin [Rhodoferax antarcticus]|uniref:type II toxin-antitoxin system death-on-curing family toxin n=1 Tax=Rhodoferax antarcticus TaxID=81479 RepID=UPI0029FEE25F|nr:type II toxin-antitoxin system death-on-curing family toxin [Rhodoferax antarcticus]MCW2310673.1 death-on-curing protein [Rhodoferax antarcticus]